MGLRYGKKEPGDQESRVKNQDRKIDVRMCKFQMCRLFKHTHVEENFPSNDFFGLDS